MSMARKHRREVQRRLAYGEFDAEDTKKVLGVVAEQAKAEMMLKEIMPKFEMDIREKTITAMLVYQLAMLRCTYGFGYKRLKEFHSRMLHFAADMKENRTSTSMLVEMLRDECGYDFEKETEIIDQELTAYEEKREKELNGGNR